MRFAEVVRHGCLRYNQGRTPNLEPESAVQLVRNRQVRAIGVFWFLVGRLRTGGLAVETPEVCGPGHVVRQGKELYQDQLGRPAVDGFGGVGRPAPSAAGSGDLRSTVSAGSGDPRRARAGETCGRRFRRGRETRAERRFRRGRETRAERPTNKIQNEPNALDFPCMNTVTQ